MQIHLQQNRLDLAQKEAVNARKWAQDSLLVNIAESWVGMREVRVHLQQHANTTTNVRVIGRRKISSSILCLRRARSSLSHTIHTIACLASSSRATPRPTRRGGSRVEASARAQSRRSERTCQSGGVEYDPRQGKCRGEEGTRRCEEGARAPR